MSKMMFECMNEQKTVGRTWSMCVCMIDIMCVLQAWVRDLFFSGFPLCGCRFCIHKKQTAITDNMELTLMERLDLFNIYSTKEKNYITH